MLKPEQHELPAPLAEMIQRMARDLDTTVDGGSDPELATDAVLALALDRIAGLLGARTAARVLYLASQKLGAAADIAEAGSGHLNTLLRRGQTKI